jgi:hypothetical protein
MDVTVISTGDAVAQQANQFAVTQYFSDYKRSSVLYRHWEPLNRFNGNFSSYR